MFNIFSIFQKSGIVDSFDCVLVNIENDEQYRVLVQREDERQQVFRATFHVHQSDSHMFTVVAINSKGRSEPSSTPVHCQSTGLHC